MKYLIVVESPEVENGRFGNPIDKFLLNANIPKEECQFFYVIEEKVRNFVEYYSDFKKHVPSERLAAAWNVLREKVRSEKPRVIILLGEHSLGAFTGNFNIENRRGSLFVIENVPALATFSPNRVFGQNWYSVAIIHDLKRAKEVAEGRTKCLNPSMAILDTPSGIDSWFERVAVHNGYCSFDIETTVKGGEWIKCIGFASSETEGIVVPFPQDSLEPQLDLLSVIRKWMVGGQIKWIGQNAFNFDIPYIHRVWGFELKNLWVDTMVLHHMLYPEFPHDLATIASFFTTIPFWKDQSDKDLYLYNCYDVCATYGSAMRMVEEAKQRKSWPIYESYYGPLLTPLRKISMRGIRIDKIYQKEMRNVLKTDIKSLQSELDAIYKRYTNSDTLNLRLRRLQRLSEAGRKWVRLPNKKKGKITRRKLESQIKDVQAAITKTETLNVRSTKDLAQFLYGVLDLPVKTKKGKITTDETALNQLFIKTNHPFLKTMIYIRRKRNTLSRWGNLKTDENDLISTYYKFAETGRLTSGKFSAK